MEAVKKLEKPQEERSLVRKLAEVQALVGRIPKRGRNDFHKYDYVTEADVLNAVRDGMAERQLVLFPSADKVEFVDVPTKSGQPQRLCTVTSTFTIEDGETGETRSFKMLGQGMDQGDKAFYKGMTGAEKYAVLKLFMIPTGDDPEADSPERSSAPAQRTQPKPAQASKAQQVAQELKAKAQAKPGLVVDQQKDETEEQASTRHAFAAMDDGLLGAAIDDTRNRLEGKSSGTKTHAALLERLKQLEEELARRLPKGQAEMEMGAS